VHPAPHSLIADAHALRTHSEEMRWKRAHTHTLRHSPHVHAFGFKLSNELAHSRENQCAKRTGVVFRVRESADHMQWRRGWWKFRSCVNVPTCVSRG
jgi:hypothetical protein